MTNGLEICTLTSKHLEIHTIPRGSGKGRRWLNMIKRVMRTLAEVSKLQIEKEKKRVVRTDSKSQKAQTSDILEKVPTASRFLSRRRTLCFPGAAVKLSDAFDLLQSQLQQLLLADDVQVTADAGILTSKPLDLGV